MRLIRVKEAADLLGVKCSSVRKLDERGVLRSIRDWSGHRRFQEQEVLEYRQSLLEGRGMNIRDHGLGNTDSFTRGVPRARPCIVIDDAYHECPNCGCQSLCEIEVDVEAPMLRGKKGVGRYLGCPACPWASPMLMTANAVAGEQP